MICSVNCFEDGLLPVGSESMSMPDPSTVAVGDGEEGNSVEYIGLVADMIDVVLSQPEDLCLNAVQAESMAVQFLREAIPNIERDAEVFGILGTIENARTTCELAVAAGQLRLLARAISAPDQGA